MNITEIASHRIFQFVDDATPLPAYRSQNFNLPLDTIARLNAISAFLDMRKTAIVNDCLSAGLAEFESQISASLPDGTIQTHRTAKPLTFSEYYLFEKSRLSDAGQPNDHFFPDDVEVA
jgi:hypothetical protein